MIKVRILALISTRSPTDHLLAIVFEISNLFLGENILVLEPLKMRVFAGYLFNLLIQDIVPERVIFAGEVPF